jgi:hypothetical protein
MRILSTALVAAAAAALLALPAAGGPASVGSAQYVVRADPRLCPSPLCGGYWVALANHSRTLCTDERFRPRCYVATAVDEEQHPVTGLWDAALVRGELEPWTFEGFGELGALVVGTIRVPAGPGARGVYFRVRDLGIRCVRAPCYSLRTVRLNTWTRGAVSGLDLGSARLDRAQRERAQRELTSASGLLLLGTVERRADGSRVLRASRVYLEAPQPRA